MDNDVGITPAGFITKPVRFDEPLEWLGSRLQLQWRAHAPAPPPPALPPDPPRPAREQLLALREVVNLGYLRGVRRLLDEIEAERPQSTAWLAQLRKLAQDFQFARITPLIDTALALAETAGS